MKPGFSPLFLAASAAALVTSVVGAAQTPTEPLGDLLDVIPLPEKPAADTPADAEASQPASPGTPPPPVRPGSVEPIDLPPSRIVDEPAPPVVLEAPAEALAGDLTEAKTEADAQAEADAAWEAVQEQRRQAINAVEAPIVDRLNAEGAARARAETRRFEEERMAYERSLAEAEEERRRVQAEHEAEMAAYAERVLREQAEYRARVAACRDGDRHACRPDDKR